MSQVSVTTKDGVATLVLHRPPQNRIGNQMVDELDRALDEIAGGDARAVVLRTEGPDFSFGGDIEPWPGWGRREMRTHFEHYLQTFNRFERLPVPTIAAVRGRCFGGGLELAVRADLIIAGASARFGHPEQSIGIITLLGGVYRIAERVGRSRAMRWALTSEQVPAAEMERFGVVDRVVDDDALDDEAAAFAARVAAGPTLAHAAHKALLRTWAVGGTAAADEVIFDVALPLFDSADTRMAIPTAVEAAHAGRPRPVMPFEGR
ncbi:enoyl-CoA hydratase/isomerase family protein [Actinomycetospora sp. TBRC 11914]|uniref:enoyl-CoA hydratase/isomerase family protein n=1 Tax=Actinomycetospora sp. TBRC 11914 TaxID=2729387 RepID=UPI00145E4426|nr:enoyl-CoA hydratase/isomerase family protein [Actinomycetospora sp. TBRC 11914]NMO93875.1 enoyl-CoA hydratase/isomerase family protein [Actinomycetospora sp. TBRC 11914]